MSSDRKSSLQPFDGARTTPVTGDIIDSSGSSPFKAQLGIVSFRSRFQLANASARELEAKLNARLHAVQHALSKQLDVTKKQIDAETSIQIDRIIADSAAMSAKLSSETMKALKDALLDLGKTFQEGLEEIQNQEIPDVVKQKNIDTFSKMFEQKYVKIEELYDL